MIPCERSEPAVAPSTGTNGASVAVLSTVDSRSDERKGSDASSNEVHATVSTVDTELETDAAKGLAQ
jgi:hypothetical protein